MYLHEHHKPMSTPAVAQLIIGFKNQVGAVAVPPTRERAISIIKDVFISAAERDIYTGDSVIVNIIDKDGVHEERFPLRRD
ncbi:proteasome, subunit beta, putative [Ixodes scapularis]|uniref:Proteasome, subunit beta, putative n=1 Tax=Ixodes scapularis TaxID=6945 RepID=B7QF40_IXOSC|nr:proteasome, subunit beta, putative [Ixodes scapularis]|eukprot:XP_002414154.1 proteasome, subunit beta, putative [Ixodes scapularis]